MIDLSLSIHWDKYLAYYVGKKRGNYLRVKAGSAHVLPCFFLLPCRETSPTPCHKCSSWILFVCMRVCVFIRVILKVAMGISRFCGCCQLHLCFQGKSRSVLKSNNLKKLCWIGNEPGVGGVRSREPDTSIGVREASVLVIRRITVSYYDCVALYSAAMRVSQPTIKCKVMHNVCNLCRIFFCLCHADQKQNTQCGVCRRCSRALCTVSFSCVRISSIECVLAFFFILFIYT